MSGYSGVDVTRRAVRRECYPSISAVSFADDGHFLIIVPVDFRLLSDLIRCRPMFEFNPIIHNFWSCSSNMAAEGIGEQALGAVARRRRATLLVYKIFTVTKERMSNSEIDA